MENICDLINVKNNNIIKKFIVQKIQTGNNLRYIIYWSFFENYIDFINAKLYSNVYNKFRPIIQY